MLTFSVGVATTEGTSGEIDADEKSIARSYLTPRPERSAAHGPDLEDHARAALPNQADEERELAQLLLCSPSLGSKREEYCPWASLDGGGS
jgi:anti-sigma factor RsiW